MEKQKLLLLMMFAAVFIFFGQVTHAQQKDSIPLWVMMMKDEKANYNETVKVFEEFWKSKEKPEVENELFEGRTKNKQRRIIANSDTRKYAFEYKQFLNWKRAIAAFVQPDGRILGKEEQLRLLEDEKKMREQAIQQ